jgi:hypothetical protein
VWDRLAPEQTPLEQAAYFHLFRLSFGGGFNWCRVGKRELMRRLRVSERRLNVVLDGLVRKGHVRPLHRSPRGTLYRVFLPSEILKGEKEPGLQWGEMIPREAGPPAAAPPESGTAPSPLSSLPVSSEPGGTSPGRRKKKDRPLPEPALESPLNEERFADVSGRAPSGPGMGEMADWFFAQHGRKATAAERQLAVTTLTALLEDGFSRKDVQRAVAWLREHHPEEQTLDRLPYFITRALEGE